MTERNRKWDEQVDPILLQLAMVYNDVDEADRIEFIDNLNDKLTLMLLVAEMPEEAAEILAKIE